MRDRAHTLLLRIFGRLPDSGRAVVIQILFPRFTAAAAVVLIAPDDRVLLVQQRYRDGWGLPGGFLHRREEPAAAARREVREEIGVDIGEPTGLPAAVRTPDRRHFSLVFRHEVDEPIVTRARPTSVEIVECAWFALDALPVLIDDIDQLLAAAGLEIPSGAVD
jgi:ADP-ribose pyrophosphatase YjhB (NUDIX family)